MSVPAEEPRRARRRSWQQDPAGRRARILEAASRAFSRDGFQRARVADIAREADVGEGTVYNLFVDKRGLLVAVGESYGRALAAAAFDDLPKNFHPRDIGLMVQRIFSHVRTADAPLSVFLLADDPNEGRLAQDANRREMLRAIESTLEGWMARRLIPRVHPRILAELHFGLVECALRECFLRHGGEEEVAYITETSRALAATLGQSRALALVRPSKKRSP